MNTAAPDQIEILPTKRSTSKRRLKTLLFIGALVFACIYGFKYFWLEHPVGTGPAGPPVPRDAFQSVWSDRDVLLIGLGDSVTDGLGSQPGSKSYFNRLVKITDDDPNDIAGICLSAVLPNLRHENFARSGTTSIEALEYLVPLVEVQSEETFGIVVMTTGGNDIIHNYGRQPPVEGAMYGASYADAKPWIENFRLRLSRILDEIELRFPGGCEIFLGNIYDPTDGVGNAVLSGLPRWPDALRIHNDYNSIIENVCEQRVNVHMIDIRSAFLGHGIYCRQFWNSHYRAGDPTYWYWDNFEDPNNRGYDAIRRLFLNEMAGVLPDRLKNSTSDQTQ
ncbi:MAG: SGNH/GDSL hydrolase family protein [Planctomycetaceae bacterium]